jgi:hypothetical protein
MEKRRKRIAHKPNVTPIMDAMKTAAAARWSRVKVIG